jgi:four helix bundle protein
VDIKIIIMSETSPLKSKSFLFAIRIVKLYKHLTIEKKEFVLSKQVLRSGTNPGAMVKEAFSAESEHDFIHKLSIGQKEISETIYWLELLNATDYITKEQFDSINQDAIEIMKLITSSIITKKKKMGLK